MGAGADFLAALAGAFFGAGFFLGAVGSLHLWER